MQELHSPRFQHQKSAGEGIVELFRDNARKGRWWLFFGVGAGFQAATAATRFVG
jgi:hypothetical protein